MGSLTEVQGRIGLDKRTFDDVVAFLKTQFSEQGLDGFTVWEARGYWKGVPERTLIVSVAVIPEALSNAQRAITGAAKSAKQEAVYVAVGGSVEIIQLEGGK